VIGSLVKLKFLLEQEKVEPLVSLERKAPWVDSPMFVLQILNKCQCESWSLKRKKQWRSYQ
jgi:hypothetical protein